MATLILIALAFPNYAHEATVETTYLPQVQLLDCSHDRLACALMRVGRHGGECVEFIQRLYESYYSDPAFRGYAGDIVPNSKIPRVGDAVLTFYGKHHAVLIAAIEGDELVLLESNLHGDGIISYGRRISINSANIIGYFHFSTTGQ